MLVEDLTAFFDLSGFAETITFEGSEITAIVGTATTYPDETYSSVLTQTKDIIAQSSDIGSITVGQDVTIDTVEWRVIEHENLSNGVVRLTINRFIS